MKPFRFPLQVLRTLREQKEQAAQQHFAKALAASEAAAKRMHDNVRELEACWDLIKSSIQSAASGAEIARLRDFEGLLEQRHVELEGEWRVAATATEQAAAEMRAAMRDRKALEQLYERRRRAHELGVAREEQKALDELAGRNSTSLFSALPRLATAEVL